MSTPNSATQNRVAAQANEVIDRSRTIHFTFSGKRYAAHPGDTIASALAANDVRIVARSFKYHRPRGLQSHGHSMNSMVQIGNQVSESVWLRKVEDGMVVDPVNVWPSLDRDAVSLTQLGSRFMPVGFYYKTFIRPTQLWPTYEKVLRNIAGLGKLNTDAKLEGGFDKQYLHGDVVVVGAGPAGLSAAVAAAKAGARVLLFEEDDALGGHLRYSSEGQTALAELISEAKALENLHIYTDTLVQGAFEDNWLFAVRGKRMFKIRGKAAIYAVGAEDQPIVFDNNDLPGIILGSAAARLLHLHGATIGKKVLVVAANDDGWRLASELKAAGIEVAAVADHRKGGGDVAATVSQSGIPTFWNHSIVAAKGKTGVVSAEIAPLNNLGSRRTINCDTVILSTAWTSRFDLPYLAGCKFGYDEERHEHLPTDIPDGVYLAGRVLGTSDLAAQLAEGDLAGREAAADLGMGEAPAAQEKGALTRKRSAEAVRTSPHNHFVGKKNGKRFVDLDEDVSDKDVKTALAEGYNSIELLKRYSTISMGPSQGKWSSTNTMRLVSEINGWTMAQTGKTTSRPPARPIKMGNLGGQMMEPVRHTPLRHWHAAHNAEMMVSGLWMRANHYGDPIAEVKAVRERVGLIDVSTLGKIKLTGPGVGAMLDKLYINKFSKLRVGRVRYGIMCTAEGVIMDDGVTARISKNEWYMTTTSSGAGRVYEWIQWWAQSGWGEGVHCSSVSEGTSAFNLAGPRSRETLAKLTDADISNESFPYMRWLDIDIAGAPCRVMRIGFTGEQSFEIQAPASQAVGVWEALMKAGSEFGIKPFGLEAQRILRLEKAHIIVGQDTDALADPLSANQAWAVKMDKADFLGKRSIARIAEHGIKQKLVGFKMVDQSITPEEGLQIVRTVPKSEKYPIGLKIIGYITSCRKSPTLNETIGLCWLPIEMAEKAGARFDIKRGQTLLEGTVHHGAFYDPSGGKLKT
ncbi:MAG: FAD-dependent oxidoreductase [Candidatus Promineifilaceae bacterium]